MTWTDRNWVSGWSRIIFGPLWRYVRNDKITDIDYNGNQLWITDVENERYLIRSHGITEKFVEQFSIGLPMK